MAKVECIFCGQNAPRAKEHVWPKWLLSELRAKDSMLRGTHLNPVFMPLDSRIQNTGSFVYPKVCELCNNGWMSGLEVDAKPIWLSLFELPPRSDELKADEARILGIWSFKTALMLNAATDYRKLVPVAHYSHLYSARDMPEHVFIDLGCSPSAKPLNWSQTQTLKGVLLPEDTQILRINEEKIYNIVLSLPNFLVRIIYLPLCGYTINQDFENLNRARRLHPQPSAIDIRFESSFEDVIDFAISASFEPISSMA